LKVVSRSHGKQRAQFYGCAGYHERGKAICTNNIDVPMRDADDIVIEAVLDDILDASMVSAAINEAMRVLQPEAAPSREESIRRELAQLKSERARLVNAIAIGGELDDLIEALRERDHRRQDLEEELHTCQSRPAMSAAQLRHMRMAMEGLANGWRQVLREQPEYARPILSTLLVGRVTFTPTARRARKLEGSGTLCGLFQDNLSRGGSSPTGFEPVFWP
jgi:hypothetical protein